MFDERRRQAALEELGILDTPPDERVDRVARLAKEMFGVPMVSVSLIDRDRQWRKSQIGLGGNEAPRQDSFCDYTVSQDRTVVVEDASTTDLFAENPFVTGDPHLRFYAAHPLHAPGGEPVGTLCVLDTEPHTFTDAQQDLLRDLAFWVQTELAQDADVDHAAVVQRALRPRAHPEIAGYTIAAGAAPRGTLAGDYYDFSRHGEALRVTLADAMGKGTGPALVAATVRASLRTAPERSLSDAVIEVDRLLEDDLADTSMFVTAVVAELRPETGELEVIDAGHSLAFVVRADASWTPLRSTNLPLGMGMGLADPRVPVTTRLEVGDAFICCSDGLLDVLDADDPFGHVERVLTAMGPDGAVREALRLANDERATDDITVVVVRRDA
ncbi:MULTISPECIES: GAF domain-containing SpoIIE family protein phosphatase [unclassified Microbacterium]|uniref:PP2C family protein-serine/threonine phosphatase n=2 Tax=Microbacterium TaxID=33882 RepID=UPI002468711A|nr:MULTISPECIES: GAF domain-containing SpoIIE family protein phosphatase [unclassified Microbacterium]MDH5132608.1 SpoIIE family protein phosphatase [Microbacterium sp. RD10]MDH5136286.1 SpoIIE family protein phosphatase [Microbacterium sp. RD11]MDH5143772.1 SpoIIE family protein phosphatase [Microbacterium sp. RD12]MDH5154737.1 SpoIIE family protein phosphatase [Microbacterium sp. RD06]